MWLEVFLDANIVPIFYVEVLADLEKSGRQGQELEVGVGRLAEKTPSKAYPNVHHRQMLLAELAGHMLVMDHRPVIGGGDVKQAGDGTIGVHVDGFPEQTALLRWQDHDFDAVERLAARRWRAELAAQDLGRDGQSREDNPSDRSEDLEPEQNDETPAFAGVSFRWS